MPAGAGEPADPIISSTVLRLLALRQPAGVAEVLLAYLPCVSDDNTTEDIQMALAAVALRDGKPNPVLVQALQDRDPQRRSAAAAAFGRETEPNKDRPGQQLFLPGLKRARKRRSIR